MRHLEVVWTILNFEVLAIIDDETVGDETVVEPHEQKWVFLSCAIPSLVSRPRRFIYFCLSRKGQVTLTAFGCSQTSQSP